MKETNYQYSLSNTEDIVPYGSNEILGQDARVQKDDGKYTNLGIDGNTSNKPTVSNRGVTAHDFLVQKNVDPDEANTSRELYEAYNSYIAQAAADSYISNRTNIVQESKRKSNHTALLTFAFFVAFVCMIIFSFIYADGGFDALFTDGGFEALWADLKEPDTKETSKPLGSMTANEWRQIKEEMAAQENGTQYLTFQEWLQKQSEEEKASLVPVTEPASGTILSGSRVANGSELTISTSNHACVVKLKDYSGVTKLSFYVRKNTKITMTVPYDYMYVYFASGEIWYGNTHLFGEDTSYSKDDDLLDFNNYTFEYTLYPVTNGNFTETKISENEFKY